MLVPVKSWLVDQRCIHTQVHGQICLHLALGMCQYMLRLLGDGTVIAGSIPYEHGVWCRLYVFARNTLQVSPNSKNLLDDYDELSHSDSLAFPHYFACRDADFRGEQTHLPAAKEASGAMIQHSAPLPRRMDLTPGRENNSARYTTLYSTTTATSESNSMPHSGDPCACMRAPLSSCVY